MTPRITIRGLDIDGNPVAEDIEVPLDGTEAVSKTVFSVVFVPTESDPTVTIGIANQLDADDAYSVRLTPSMADPIREKHPNRPVTEADVEEMRGFEEWLGGKANK